MKQQDTNTQARFQISTHEGRIRFTSEKGFIELWPHEGKALIQVGTFNGCPPELFGAEVWEALQVAMPELGLRVCQGAVADNLWIERILYAAGFKHDGTLRSWGPTFQDLKIFSILEAETKQKEPDGPTTTTAVDGSVASEHEGAAAGNEQGAVQRNGPADGVPSAPKRTRRSNKPHGTSVPAARAADEATA